MGGISIITYDKVELLIFNKLVILYRNSDVISKLDNATIEYALTELVESHYRLEKYKYSPQSTWEEKIKFFSNLEVDNLEFVKLISPLPKVEEITTDLLPGIII